MIRPTLATFIALTALTLADHVDDYHKFEHPIKHVAVIGAGPAGLQAAATLKEHNFTTVRLFERQEKPGGTWYYQESTPVREPYPDVPIEHAAGEENVREPGTVVYYHEGDDGLTLDERWREATRPSPAWYNLFINTPIQVTKLPGVDYPKDAVWQPTVHEIQRHIRTYAAQHGLNPNDEPLTDGISFSASYATKVESLRKIDGVWQIQLRRSERVDYPPRIKSTWWNEDFDAVVVASGGYDAPHVPSIAGLKEWSEIKDDRGRYRVWHGQSYRHPEPLKDKTVVLVGASVSAMGISNDIGPHVKKLYVSVRPGDRRSTLMKRRNFDRIYPGAEIIPDIIEFGALDSSTSITRGQLVLRNGTILTGIDEVILATGFRHANSFLGSLVNGTIAGNEDPDVEVKPVITEGKQGQFRNVDWRGFYLDDPTLAFTTVRPWTVGGYQALAIAKVWEGTARIPSIEGLAKEYPGHGRSFFSRSFGSQQSEAGFRKFVTWLNNESLQHGGRLVDFYPERIREEFVYFAASAAGYWEPGYYAHDNFTQSDKLPEREWSAEPPVEIFWKSLVDHEEEY